VTRLDANGPVTVVGAGPAGTSMAVYLAGQGYDVTVYESRPDMRRADLSAGRSINLALANRGFVVLDDLGVGERVGAITIPMAGRMVHSGGQESFQPYGIRPTDVIHSVSRADLNSILLDAAEATGRVSIEFDTRCRSVDLENRTMVLTDSEGAVRTVSFGVVFGTDGSASAIRESMVSAGSSKVSIEPLGHGYKELTIPANADGSFRVDPNALHIWPRGEFMAIALANPAGDFTATVFMPSAGEGPSFESVAGFEEANRFMVSEFPDLLSLVPDIVDQWTSNPVGHLATVRTLGWSHSDTAILVGDAAHAIVPFHGQGMNAAMESCRVLANHLETSASTASAFESFEAHRKPDTDAIADMAIDNYMEMRSSVIDPAYLFHRAVALELERRWPDRVSPRYSMVMFTTMRYSEALQRSQSLARVIERLTSGVSSMHHVDFDLAERLVSELDPFPDPTEALQ